jgi:hypothetical protein
VIAVATAGHRWRLLGLGFAFLLRVGVPGVVGTINVPGSPHLSTILILCFALVWPVASAQAARRSTTGSLPTIPGYCHVIVAIVTVGGLMMSGSQSAMVFAAGVALNQIVGPYLFCILLVNSLCQNPSLYDSACRFFAAVCVSEAILAIAVYYGVMRQPFQSAYLVHDYWLGLGTRQSGTLDHPLTLGLLLAAGIPFVTYFRSRIIIAAATVILLAGIAVTQSRLAIAGAAVGILYLAISRSKAPLASFGYAAIAATGYAALYQFGLFQGLTDRLEDDRGSAEGRRRASLIFFENWGEFSVSGLGLDYTKEYFLRRGIPSSSESAAFIFIVGIGLPLTVLYFGLIIWMISRGIKQARKLMPASFAAIVVFTMAQFFASIGTQSAAGLILWAIVGISLAAPSTPKTPPRTDSSSSKTSGKYRAVAKNLDSRHPWNQPLVRPARPDAAVARSGSSRTTRT